MTKTINPQRGEIWLVQFDPTKGEEIQKSRPAVVIGRLGIGRPKLRIVVPLTTGRQLSTESQNPALVLVEADETNKLDKTSAADASQVKSVSLVRFEHKIGIVPADTLDEIVAAVVFCVGYEPPSA